MTTRRCTTQQITCSDQWRFFSARPRRRQTKKCGIFRGGDGGDTMAECCDCSMEIQPIMQLCARQNNSDFSLKRDRCFDFWLPLSSLKRCHMASLWYVHVGPSSFAAPLSAFRFSTSDTRYTGVSFVATLTHEYWNDLLRQISKKSTSRSFAQMVLVKATISAYRLRTFLGGYRPKIWKAGNKFSDIKIHVNTIQMKLIESFKFGRF